MLTPEYLAGCTDKCVALYEQLNRNITNDICRRIVKTGNITSSAKWQIRQAQESGVVFDDILKEVAKYTGKLHTEIEEMFKEAGAEAVENDRSALKDLGGGLPNGLSEPMEQVLEANLKKTKDTLDRLTLTTASDGQDTFINAMNEAVMKVESGAFSYAEAYRSAIDKCADSGSHVRYPDRMMPDGTIRRGARLSLEAAARMNLLTAVNQTAAAITEKNAQELGAEYYETTAHAGAREEHVPWQGRVFKIEGADEYPNFFEETGYGDVTGLCGANCRHSFHPFFPGLSEPAYTPEMLAAYNEPKYEYNGEMLTEYQASQKMRGFERKIRDSKRKISALKAAIDETDDPKLKAELEASLQAAKNLYNARRARWTDFSDKTGIEKDYLRTRIAGQSVTSSTIVPQIPGAANASPRKAGAEYGSASPLRAGRNVPTDLKNKMSKDDYDEFNRMIKNLDEKSIRTLLKVYGKGTTFRVCREDEGQYLPLHDILDFCIEKATGNDYAASRFETLAHEIGHMFDYKIDSNVDGLTFKEYSFLENNIDELMDRRHLHWPVPSLSDQFLEAMRKDALDIADMISTRSGKEELMEALNPFGFTSGTQDFIDGLFSTWKKGNGSKEFYTEWGHGDEYYDKMYNALRKNGTHIEARRRFNENGHNIKDQKTLRTVMRNYDTAKELWANLGMATIVEGGALSSARIYTPNSLNAFLSIARKVK